MYIYIYIYMYTYIYIYIYIYSPGSLWLRARPPLGDQSSDDTMWYHRL